MEFVCHAFTRSTNGDVGITMSVNTTCSTALTRELVVFSHACCSTTLQKDSN